MTRETILKKALQMANHNLFCVSGNYACTRPREGQEAEFNEYAAEAEILRDWLAELTDPDRAAKARFERDLIDAQDGDIGVIKDRRAEIKRLQRELAEIEDAV